MRVRFPHLLKYGREISGEGVIGLHPLLKLPPSIPPDSASSAAGQDLIPFEYESCTSLDPPPGEVEQQARSIYSPVPSDSRHRR